MSAPAGARVNNPRPTFTQAQQSAIHARGNVLVIAGAGTGKTHTLIERCLQLLREGASLEGMLLVTFTEAAAAELRARLRKALESELKAIARASGPSTADAASPPQAAAERLAEQLALLDTAQISTLHSFCLRLVRENFHHLAIDPQLVILDERQTRPLARDCLTDLLAEHYAGRHPHSEQVQQLIRRAGRGSDEPLRTLVGKLHGYAQTLPDPEQWFTDQLATFREPTPTQWHAWLLTGFNEWRDEWLAALASAPEMPALMQARAALLAANPTRAGDLQPPSATTSRRHAVPNIAAALAEVIAADSDWPRGTKTKLRPPFAKLFEEARFFLSLTGADGNATALDEDWEWSRHGMLALVQLTRQFTERFGEAKRQLGGVDFADLEQLTLRLIRDETTGVARRCRDQFTHICVDEYQDINAAQDAILHAVSGEGAHANRFLVGDLKQSIYRFRLANPRIFAGYAKAWREATTSHTNVIALSDNFRSRADILNFVNPLFRALMRETIGGVAYDAEAELKFGGTVPDATNPLEQSTEATAASSRVELHLLTQDTDDATDEHDATAELLDLLAVEREARCVALRLRALQQAGHEVLDEDTKTPRPIQWRDMVVLMRSPGSRVESFAQEFHRAGVPLRAERGGFYEALEVSDLLNLLRLLDNPLQDLPLLAVLRSPLVALSLEELVAIRAASKERLFWDALTRFCVADDNNDAADMGRSLTLPPLGCVRSAGLRPAAATSANEPRTSNTIAPSSRCGPEGRAPELSAHAKAAWFLARFAAWREQLRLSSLTDCLERVLAETHYEALLLAEPRGAEQVANVRRLLDLARQFDPYQRQGLHRFLQFIAAQAEAELDHAPAPVPTDNTVRVMSIHRSKGLEFPVVAVAGLGTRFNERDLRGDILLDEKFGLCPVVVPPNRERHYASLPHWLAQRRGRRELVGEELRLLYVALTRARDTLLLFGTDSGKDVAAKWGGPAMELNDLAVLKARCPLNWLRAWLPSVTRADHWQGDAAGRNELLSWDFYTADDERLARSGDTPVPDATAESFDPASGTGVSPSRELAELRAKLEWSYPHESSTHEPAKTSVTVLRRRAAEADPDAVAWFRPQSGGSRQKRGEMSATQLGVAHHTFLQCVDIARTATALDLRNEAERLVQADFLTEREAAALDFAALLGFWESPVGQQVRAHAGRVQREVPFTARFTVRELEAMGLMQTRNAETGTRNSEDEFVVVQGVADLVVFGEREIWLLDYKTDQFDETELPAKLQEHGPQLSLYALALERIYQKQVTRTWLHFLALGKTELL